MSKNKEGSLQIWILDRDGCNQTNHIHWLLLLLLSPMEFQAPLMEERWDYQGQQVFKSLLHSLQCGDHVQSGSKSCVGWLVGGNFYWGFLEKYKFCRPQSVSVTDDYNNYYYWICSWLVVLTVGSIPFPDPGHFCVLPVDLHSFWHLWWIFITNIKNDFSDI